MPRPWTPTQQRRYRALCAKLAAAGEFDDDTRRAVIARVCGGATSTRDIGYIEMARLVAEMERLCAGAGCPKRQSKPTGSHTKRQWGKIMALAGVLGWREARLNGFVARVTQGKCASPNQLSVFEASDVILGLEGEIASIESGTARAERPTSARPGAPTRPRFRFVPGGMAS